MPVSQSPRLRALECFPVSQPGGEVWFALRDPEGFAGSVVLPRPAALLASLMDGSRDLAELSSEFQRISGQPLHADDVNDLIRKLDDRLLLDNDRFRAQWKVQVETYLNNPVRPAAHAGGGYAGSSGALTTQLDGLFTSEQGPGAYGAPGSGINGRGQLRGLLNPHIDLRRGGPTFAWGYRRLVEESDADLFVIFGTAHQRMGNMFSVSKKHFDTPLGVVSTDKQFVGRLGQRVAAQPGGRDLNLFADELAHRPEHSIEFQVIFLQHLLGEHREFKVVPILVGSFHEFIRNGRQPAESSKLKAFVTALRECVADYAGKVCFIASGDLAHIGERFGDKGRLTQDGLAEQSQDDRELLDAACRVDPAGFFSHVAERQDRSRICGLSPTYTMLEAMRPQRGELLAYGQAVEPNGTSCVSFASLAFYGG